MVPNVPIWSTMVQICLKKSSKWVRHNQVSGSTLGPPETNILPSPKKEMLDPLQKIVLTLLKKFTFVLPSIKFWKHLFCKILWQYYTIIIHLKKHIVNIKNCENVKIHYYENTIFNNLTSESQGSLMQSFNVSHQITLYIPSEVCPRWCAHVALISGNKVTLLWNYPGHLFNDISLPHTPKPTGNKRPIYTYWLQQPGCILCQKLVIIFSFFFLWVNFVIFSKRLSWKQTGHYLGNFATRVIYFNLFWT